MESLILIMLVLLAAELFMILSNLSKLRAESDQRQEKLTVELSEIKKLLEK